MRRFVLTITYFYMNKEIKVQVQRTATYTVTISDEFRALEAFKPVAIRMKKDAFTIDDVAEAVASCYFASDHAYNTHMYGVGLLRDPNLGIAIRLNTDEVKATTSECNTMPEDVCPGCGKKHPLVAEFGLCGKCAEANYTI